MNLLFKRIAMSTLLCLSAGVFSAAGNDENRGTKRPRVGEHAAHSSKRQRGLQGRWRFRAQDESFVIVSPDWFSRLYDLFIKVNKTQERTPESFYQQLSAIRIPYEHFAHLVQTAENIARIAIDRENLEGVRSAILQKQLIRPDGSIARAFFSPGEQLEEVVLELIRAERKSIKVACYMLTNPRIFCELARARQRRVFVEVVIDEQEASDRYINQVLKTGALTGLWGRKWFGTRPKMHNKFFLFEDNIEGNSLLVTGSANCTWGGHQLNAENIIVINNAAVIAQFNKQFGHLHSPPFTALVEPIRQDAVVRFALDCTSHQQLSLRQLISNSNALAQALQRVRDERQQTAVSSSQAAARSIQGQSQSTHSSAASSTSSSQITTVADDGIIRVRFGEKEFRLNRGILKEIPYFQVLLDPKEMATRYYGLTNEYVLNTDQQNMALLPKRRLREALVARARERDHIAIEQLGDEDAPYLLTIYTLLSRIHNGQVSTYPEILRQLRGLSFSDPEHIQRLARVTEKLFSPQAIRAAFHQSEKEKLISELQPSNGYFMHGFFSPAGPIERVITTLIDAEKRSIRLASYLIDSPVIIQALSRAQLRGVDINIVLDPDASDGTRMLQKYGLPRCEWRFQANRQGRRPLMHNKFILFERNLFNRSVLLSGSANYTVASQQNNEENVIVTNDQGLIQQFARQFNFLRRTSECFTSSSSQLHPLDRPEEQNMRLLYPDATFLLRALERLYAEYILEGNAQIDQVPRFMRERVECNIAHTLSSIGS